MLRGWEEELKIWVAVHHEWGKVDKEVEHRSTDRAGWQGELSAETQEKKDVIVFTLVGIGLMASPLKRETVSWVGLGRELEDSFKVWTSHWGQGGRYWTGGHVCAVAPLCSSLGVEENRDGWLSSANPLPTFFTNRVPFYLERQWDKWKHIYQPSLYPRVACEQPMRCKPKSLGGPSRKVFFLSVCLFVGAFTWHMPLALYPFSLLECRHKAWSKAAMLWPQVSKHEDKSHKLMTEWGERKSLLWCIHQPCGFLLWEKKQNFCLIQPLTSGSITYS